MSDNTQQLEPVQAELVSNLKYKIGDEFDLLGRKYRIQGTDESDPHPAGIKHWNYWLVSSDKKHELRFTEDQLEFLLSGGKNETNPS